jgi:TolB-like protein/Tfp pilus assembly protein PilF
LINYFWRQRPANAPIKTLVVLPFKSLVAENRDETLEMGMADTLIARLGSNREIVVRPLSSVRRFAGLEQDPQSAGRELGVESVLDGSVQRWGDKIRVNVRLIKTADGESLWSDTFDEKFTDIFVVQDAISKKVAESLKLRLGAAQMPPEKRATENVEAYRLYLQGRYFALKLTPPEIRRGIAFYQQAIDADPLYALAYAGIADAYRTLPITSDVPPNEAFPKAKIAAERALEIDSQLADAYIVRGWIASWYEWDWKNAEENLQKAVEMSPNNSEAHRAYAHFLSNLGRHAEAVEEIRRARELDPLSLIINALEGQMLFYAEREAEAIKRLNKTFEIDPNFWIAHINLAKIYIEQKRYDEAVAELQKAREFSGGNSEMVSLLGYALAKSARQAEAQKTVEELESAVNQRYIPPYNIALIYNGLGENAKTFDWLEKAFEQRDVRMTLLKIDPK